MKVLVEGLTHAEMLEKNSLGGKHSSLAVALLLDFPSLKVLVAATRSFLSSVMVPSMPRDTVLGVSLVDAIVVAMLGIKQRLRGEIDDIFIGVVPEVFDVSDVVASLVKVNEETSVSDKASAPGNFEGPSIDRGAFRETSDDKLPLRIGIDFPKVVAP